MCVCVCVCVGGGGGGGRGGGGGGGGGYPFVILLYLLSTVGDIQGGQHGGRKRKPLQIFFLSQPIEAM